MGAGSLWACTNQHALFHAQSTCRKAATRLRLLMAETASSLASLTAVFGLSAARTTGLSGAGLNKSTHNCRWGHRNVGCNADIGDPLPTTTRFEVWAAALTAIDRVVTRAAINHIIAHQRIDDVIPQPAVDRVRVVA